MRRTILLRQAIAVVVLLGAIALVALGVQSCQVSEHNSALRNYTNTVSSTMAQSNETGVALFDQLDGGGGTGGPVELQTQIDQTRAQAQDELDHAERFSVPDQMRGAQQNLLLALQMRRDGIQAIADHIQPALASSTNRAPLMAIAAAMAHFYASDVVYTLYSAPQIASALHQAGIAVGANGEVIQSSQILPNLSWLAPSYIAAQLHVTAPGLGVNLAPGTHGHALNSVSVGATTLKTTTTNTLPASPPPTFTLHFTNTGQNNERNVVLTVTLGGTSISGRTVVAQTIAGHAATAAVTLTSSPPAGSYQVTATVQKVAGEKNVQNNSLTFPVTFR